MIPAWSEEEFLTQWLGRPARLAGALTVVDSARFERDLFSRELLAERGWSGGPLDRRTVADLLVDQVESASEIVTIGEPRKARGVRATLRLLNPTARLYEWADGPPGATPQRGHESHGAQAGTSDRLAFAGVTPPWLHALRDEPPWPSKVPAGVCLVYQRPWPFERDRFQRFLQDRRPGLLRGKGQVWLADDWERCIGYSGAGAVQRIFPAGRWWASLPPGEWPACEAHRRALLEAWHPRFGDRRQRLVFLGADLDIADLAGALDDCLAEAPVGEAERSMRAESRSSAPH